MESSKAVKILLAVLLLFFTGRTALGADLVWVEVEGIEGENLKNVEAALRLPPGIVRDGAVDQELLMNFERGIPEKTQRALEPFGYYNAQVEVVKEAIAPEGSLIHVKVFLEDPIRIAGVHVRATGPGGQDLNVRKLLTSFPLRVGDVLNQVKYEKAKEEIKTTAQNLGYLGAEYTSHEIRLNRAERRAEITLILATGPKYRFGEVIWEGTRLYPISFLQRFVDFRPGDPYSYSRIYQTHLNLINSDRFASVNIQTDKEEARDGRVPVRIQVEPSAPKRLRPGIGYSTDFGARVMLRYQDVNAFHRGHEFNSDLSLAERRQAISSTYSLPGRGHIDNRTNLKFGFQRELLNPYDNVLWTLEGERAQSFGHGIVGSGYLQFRQENFTESGQKGSSSLIVPGLRLNQRRVDNLVRPRKGFQYHLDARGSGQVLGAETNFLQLLGNGNLLIPLTAKFSFIPRVQFGLTWQKDPLTDIPPSLRFYAGGDRSIRGYTYQSLGPKDASGNVIGGRHLLVGNLELEYMVTKSWGAAVFYDAGNAFNNFEDLTWAQGAGLGLRYYTPVGPIRVDLARQINVENPGYQLHISVGFSL